MCLNLLVCRGLGVQEKVLGSKQLRGLQVLQGAVNLGKQAGFAIFNVMEWAKHKGPAELKTKSE